MKNWAVFADTGYAAAVETTIYTVPAGQTAIIDKCTSYSAGGGTLTLKIVPPAGTPGAANVIATKVFAAGESYLWPEMVGQQLVGGNTISEIAAGASTVSRRITGRSGT